MIQNDWKPFLQQESQKEYFKTLQQFLSKEYEQKTIYPPKEEIFSAFQYTQKKDIKVVILGQDPYHGPNQAHGLAFSVNPENKIPPSLRNMYKEIELEYHIQLNRSGDLRDWAKQGVFLLNPILTVEEHKPLSHQKIGWQTFTNQALIELNKENRPIVFLLWGNKAKEVQKFLNNPNHLILTSVHPSPLSASRGFFGCNHFQLANDFLEKNGQKPIDWTQSNQ